MAQVIGDYALRDRGRATRVPPGTLLGGSRVA